MTNRHKIVLKPAIIARFFFINFDYKISTRMY